MLVVSFEIVLLDLVRMRFHVMPCTYLEQLASEDAVHCTDATSFSAALQVEHSLHCVPPTASLKVVPVHAEQTVWPAAEIIPGTQAMHGVAASLSASFSPAMHSTHLGKPSVF